MMRAQPDRKIDLPYLCEKISPQDCVWGLKLGDWTDVVGNSLGVANLATVL